MTRIREATTEDLEILLALRMAFLAENAEESGGPDAGTETLEEANRAYLARALPSGDFRAWVAEEDLRIVATSGLVLFQRPPYSTNPSGLEAYVMNMYTEPEYRRRGLAARLLDECIAFARTAGAGRVWLHPTRAGRPLYQKAGFSDAIEMGRLV